VNKALWGIVLLVTLFSTDNKAFAIECPVGPSDPYGPRVTVTTSPIVPGQFIYLPGSVSFSFSASSCVATGRYGTLKIIWSVYDTYGRLISSTVGGLTQDLNFPDSATYQVGADIKETCLTEDGYGNCGDYGDGTFLTTSNFPTLQIAQVSPCSYEQGVILTTAGSSSNNTNQGVTVPETFTFSYPSDPPGLGFSVFQNKTDPNLWLYKINQIGQQVFPANVTIPVTAGGSGATTAASIQVQCTHGIVPVPHFSVTADKPHVAPGETVTFTANPVGMTGPFQFSWGVFPIGNNGAAGKIISSGSTGTWVPPVAGSFLINAFVTDSFGTQDSWSSGYVVGACSGRNCPVPSTPIHVWQVIKDPTLPSPDGVGGIIDLVAGKNADVVVTATPNQDVTNSTVTLCGHTFGPSTNFADKVTGSVDFQLSPVPTDSKCVNVVSTMQAQLLDINNHGVGAASIQVHPRTLVAIHPVFVSLDVPSSDPSKFPVVQPPSSSDMNISQGDGYTFLNNLFPIGEAYTPEISNIPVHGEAAENSARIDSTFDDRQALAALVDKTNASQFYQQGITNVIGLVSSAYFPAKEPGMGRVGESELHSISAEVTAGDVASLVHEFGHMYCLRYDNQTGCDFINYNTSSDPTANARLYHNQDGADNSGKYLGFSNKTFGDSSYPYSTGYQFQRGQFAYSESLLVPAIHPSPAGYWLNSKEYLQLFDVLLPEKQTVPGTSPPTFLGAGSLDATGSFVPSSTYIMDNPRSVPTNPNGSFSVVVQDAGRKTLYSGNYEVNSAPDNPTALELSFTVPMPANGVFVTASQIGSKRFISTPAVIVVPAEVISDGLKNVPDAALVGDPATTRAALANDIAQYRTFLLSGQLNLANNYLQSTLSPDVGNSISTNYASSSLLDIGRSEMNELLLTSQLRVYAAIQGTSTPPVNPFISLVVSGGQSAGETSNLDVRQVVAPTDKDHIFLYQIYFNGEKVQTQSSDYPKIIRSAALRIGPQFWEVQTFLISRADWLRHERNLEKLKQKVASGLEKLNFELNLDARAAIQADIVATERVISSENGIVQAEMTQVGPPTITSFNVQ